MILGIRAVRSVLYILVMLSKIQAVKKIFALQVEQGDEVYIPNELSLKHLPINYQFYDCLLLDLQENMRQGTKDFYSFKNTYRLQLYNRENFVQRILEKLGISEPMDENGIVEPRRLAIKHNVVNKL